MPDKLSDIAICEKCGSNNKKDAQKCVHCGHRMQRDYYQGLWLRNIIITLVLFLVPFIILFYIVNFEISMHFENQVKRGLDYSVDITVKTVMSFLEERKSDLLSIATVDITSIEEIRVKDSFLKRFFIEKPWFDFMSIADTNGAIIYTTDSLSETIKEKEYFTRPMRGECYNTGIFYSQVLDTIAMIISCPLMNKHNQTIGVILASVNLETFYNLMVDLRIGETSEIFLVDSNGIFLSTSKLGGTVLREYGHYKNDPNPHTGSGGVITHRDYRGKKVLCAYRKFDGLNWYLVSEMDVEEALAPATRLKNVMYYIFLIVGGFLLVSTIIFSKQVTDLLKKLTRHLKSALDDISDKKNTINTINVELRKRLRDCESLSKQLRVSEEYIKTIIDSISSGLIAVDKTSRITYCNAFAHHFTTQKEINMQSDLYSVFPVLKKEDIRKNIENIFVHNEAFRIRKTQVDIDGKSMTLGIAGFPIIESEEIQGATLLLNDITEQERLHAQMADYEKLSSLSQLALGAAHEINNPLLGITSYIELLIEEETDVERKTQAKQVLDSAYRISETVRGLLNFARPSPPKFTKVSLNKLITETLSFLHHQPLFRKIKIVKNLSEDVPQITADVNQIRQVFINILLNAAQAMPDGGKLNITTGKVKFEDMVEIEIRDTGVGIADEMLKKVFDPFFTSKKGQGTGLGLSISYSYIKSHNGDIRIASVVQKGTTVTIVLPIRQTGEVQSEVEA
jgi:PAS domain S-box-containing protein